MYIYLHVHVHLSTCTWYIYLHVCVHISTCTFIYMYISIQLDCETCDYELSESADLPPDYKPAQRFPVSYNLPHVIS